MNRAERRIRQKYGQSVTKSTTVTEKDFKELKSEATSIAFFLMLTIPVTVIHNHFAELIKKEVDGKSRAERFCDLCIDLYKAFERGEVTLDELGETLKNDTGIVITRQKEV